MHDRSGRAGARRRAYDRSVVAFVVLVLAPLLAGCVTEATHPSRGATLAFESIDGPPRPVFDRLVARLDAEARARQVAVVSRETPARYRVRGYLAVKADRRSASIAWVWDVYDSDLRRAVRIAGEEPAGRGARDAWVAADDRVLGRIAEVGMRQLAAFVAAPYGSLPGAPETTPPEPPEPPAVAPAGEIRVATVTPSAVASGRRAR
ncbi:MAG: hypothetical protein GEU91_01695 [Rhizobiales bacterium]|nr:hypothetical protein [Hyphomicrobiales bacterium]